MARMNFGGTWEEVITREEFPLATARQVLKNEVVAVLGYGVQGPAQSLNMRDNGIKVIIGQRKSDKFYWNKAIKDGWKPGKTLFDIEEATKRGTIIQYLVSDAAQMILWPAIKPHLTQGKALYFSHGFSITYKEQTKIIPPRNIDVILVAPKERRMRIEVGYGLEGIMTDGRAGGIIRDVMTPHFKSGDYNTGIAEGAKAVIAVLEGGLAPDLPDGESGAPAKSEGFLQGPDLSLTERILLGAFIFGIIGLFTVIGVLTPGVGWFLYFFLIPFWAMFPMVVVGTTGALYLLVAYLVIFPAAKLIIKKSDWYAKAAQDLKTKGRAGIGGFTFTSRGSGSSGSSGFSGGGGSSGGGGASGSW